MTTINKLPTLILLLAFLLSHSSPIGTSADLSPWASPHSSPSADAFTPTPALALAPAPFSPHSSPSTSPGFSPPGFLTPTPAPARADGGNGIVKEDMKSGKEEKNNDGGKKAGIALGVFGTMCVAGVGGFVYNKRKQNLRRGQYGFAARTQII